jgi:hypothetical protein
MPQIILGTITAADLILAVTRHYQSALLIFWSAINTITMCSFVGYAIYQITMTQIKNWQARTLEGTAKSIS